MYAYRTIRFNAHGTKLVRFIYIWLHKKQVQNEYSKKRITKYAAGRTLNQFRFFSSLSRLLIVNDTNTRIQRYEVSYETKNPRCQRMVRYA